MGGGLKMGLAKCIRRRGHKIEGRIGERTRWQARGVAEVIEWGREKFIELDNVRQWQYIEYAEARAETGLPICEGIPRESHPRLKISSGWIGEQRVPNVGRSIGK